MWKLASHGQTFYVNHVDSDIPWSTKETPSNDHTKGSIKFKKCKLTIDDDNCATISKLGILDITLPTPHPPKVRILARYESDFHKALQAKEYPHTAIKLVHGSCHTAYMVCDMDEKYATLAALKYNDFRILAANEYLHKAYDMRGTFIDSEHYDEYLEDDDDE